GLFERCLVEQFHGSTIEFVEGAVVEGSIVALVAMRWPDRHGSIGVSASRGTAESLAREIAVGGNVDLDDWMGELTSLVFGRFKLALRQRAVEVRCSTSVVLNGVGIRLRSAGAIRVFTVTRGDARLLACFDLGSCEPLERPAPSEDSSSEFLLPGDIILFD